MSTLHIVVAMKPLEGNFMQNALEHGVAGINVDGCRIGMGSEDRKAYEEKRHSFDGMTGKVCGDTFVKNASPQLSSDLLIEGSKLGRWPSNVLLGHLEGCKKVGMKKVKGHKGYPNGPGGLWSHKYQEESQRAKDWNNTSTKADNDPWAGHADADGKETVEEWECQEGCPVKEMDEQSGITKSPRPYMQETVVRGEVYKLGSLNNKSGKISTHHGDTGGASRFFKQVKDE